MKSKAGKLKLLRIGRSIVFAGREGKSVSLGLIRGNGETITGLAQGPTGDICVADLMRPLTIDAGGAIVRMGHDPKTGGVIVKLERGDAGPVPCTLFIETPNDTKMWETVL